MQSAAETPEAYLAELPESRRNLVMRLRQMVLEHLPEGYEEAMNWGMLVYQVPLSIVPKTYNNQPLAYAGLANQKQYVSLYLMGIYADPELRSWFEQGFAEAGLKLRAGKSCIRFKHEAEVPWDLIGPAIAAVSLPKFVEIYNKSRIRN